VKTAAVKLTQRELALIEGSDVLRAPSDRDG
jgi:hypothetical protein